MTPEERRKMLDRKRYLAHQEERKMKQREYYRQNKEAILLKIKKRGLEKYGTFR